MLKNVACLNLQFAAHVASASYDSDTARSFISRTCRRRRLFPLPASSLPSVFPETSGVAHPCSHAFRIGAGRPHAHGYLSKDVSVRLCPLGHAWLWEIVHLG